MPFDNAKDYPLSRDRLYQLVTALRRPMPEGFFWDFSYTLISLEEYREYRCHREAFPEVACGSVGCALGLARVLWPDFDTAYRNIDDPYQPGIAEMPDDKYVEIFWRSYWFGVDATPADVADKLEAYLNESKPELAASPDLSASVAPAERGS